MPLAVFDIDGTLTDTMDVDLECYEAAILSELGLEMPGDWSSFEEVTDASILAVACERSGRPAPDVAIQARIADLVGELLSQQLEQSPDRFPAVRGATGVFEALRRAGWQVAMATGAWRPSALVKLKGAGIPCTDVPLASASDHPARAEIIRHAVRASSATGESVVYVGDGVWDGRAARSSGYGFVGVAPPSGEAALRSAGASAVVADFTDTESLLEHLSRASPVHGGRGG